jgi:hypothetical protein
MSWLLSYQLSQHVLAGLAITLGALVIIIRAPLLIWPEATRKFYLKWVATNLRIRLTGFVMASFALGFILTSRSLASFHEVFFFLFGWALALFSALMLLLLTFLFKEIVVSLLENMDALILRVIGGASILVGAFFIFLGVTV